MGAVLSSSSSKKYCFLLGLLFAVGGCLRDKADHTPYAVLQDASTKNGIDLLQFSSDSKRLAAVSGSLISIWDVNSRKSIALLRALHPPTHVRFSLDGEKITACGDSFIQQWGVLTSTELLSRPESCEDLSSDGSLVAFSKDGKTVVLKITTGRLTTSPSLAAHLRFFDNGVYLLADSSIWNIERNGRSDLPTPGNQILTILPDQPRLLLLVDDEIQVWSIATQIRSFPIALGQLLYATLSPSGKRVAIISTKPPSAVGDTSVRELEIFDVDSGHLVRSINPYSDFTEGDATFKIRYVRFLPNHEDLVLVTSVAGDLVADAQIHQVTDETFPLVARLRGNFFMHDAVTYDYLTYAPLWIAPHEDDDFIEDPGLADGTTQVISPDGALMATAGETTYHDPRSATPFDAIYVWDLTGL